MTGRLFQPKVNFTWQTIFSKFQWNIILVFLHKANIGFKKCVFKNWNLVQNFTDKLLFHNINIFHSNLDLTLCIWNYILKYNLFLFLLRWCATNLARIKQIYVLAKNKNISQQNRVQSNKTFTPSNKLKKTFLKAF